MKFFSLIDAYRILEVPLDAGEEEIRIAYHTKLASIQNPEKISNAYALIRNENARKRYRLNSIHSYFQNPPKQALKSIDIESLVSEIAFLSDWELTEI